MRWWNCPAPSTDAWSLWTLWASRTLKDSSGGRSFNFPLDQERPRDAKRLPSKLHWAASLGTAFEDLPHTSWLHHPCLSFDQPSRWKVLKSRDTSPGSCPFSWACFRLMYSNAPATALAAQLLHWDWFGFQLGSWIREGPPLLVSHPFCQVSRFFKSLVLALLQGPIKRGGKRSATVAARKLDTWCHQASFAREGRRQVGTFWRSATLLPMATTRSPAACDKTWAISFHFAMHLRWQKEI